MKTEWDKLVELQQQTAIILKVLFTKYKLSVHGVKGMMTPEQVAECTSLWDLLQRDEPIARRKGKRKARAS